MSTDTSLYVAIAASISFVISEILPFLPCEPNGLIHSLLVLFTNNKDKVVISSDIPKELKTINDKIDVIIHNLDPKKEEKVISEVV